MVTNEPTQAGAGHSGLPYRTSSDTEGDVARILGKLEAGGKDLAIIRLVANSPGMFRPFVHMADALLNRSRLPARARECVILHLAAHLEVPYEWAEHVPMSADAGVTDRERAVLATGSLDDDLSSFTDLEQMALRTSRSIADGAITSDDWANATKVLGEGAMVDLVLTVAWWGAFVPTVIGALGLVDPAATS